MASEFGLNGEFGATESPFAFERDGALGYVALNRRELSKFRNADRWNFAVVLPILAVLGMSTLVFLFFGFITFTTPHGC